MSEREIKFRAWDNRKNQMFFGGKDFSTIPVINMPIALKNGGMIGYFVLEQFTGLKDKNGVDIYEGDIVKYWYRSWNTAGMGDEIRTKMIKFDDGGFIVPRDGVEVLGNIHENPELLS